MLKIAYTTTLSHIYKELMKISGTFSNTVSQITFYSWFPEEFLSCV